MSATQIKKVKVTCDKCNGTGHLEYHANYVNGVCFACGGSGKIVVRKNDRKPTFDWTETAAKKIMFIIDINETQLNRMSLQQLVAMDDYVYGMTMDRKCMWLYHFYVESIRHEVLKKINAN